MAQSEFLCKLVKTPNSNSYMMDINVEENENHCILEAKPRDGRLQPAMKKRKKFHTKIEVVLRQTSEIVMVLVGMATLRGVAPPKFLECQLAFEAYEKMATLITISAPQDLVPNDVLQSLIQQSTMPPPHPMRLPTTKSSSLQPQSLFPTTLISSISPLLSLAIVVFEEPTQVPNFSPPLSPPPSPLPSPSPLPLFFDTSTQPFSRTSSPQTLEPLEPNLKATITSGVVKPTSKATAPITKTMTSMPSLELDKTKTFEDVKASSTSLKKSVSPSSIPLSISATNTNDIEATSIAPNNTTKIKFRCWASPMKYQALPKANAQPTTSTTAIFINDHRGSQTPKTMARERVLKNLVNNEPSSIILDLQHTNKQLALVDHLFLKRHIRTAKLKKVDFKYINVPIPCGICKTIANTTINVLVCDGCECAFHLECLQLSSSENIPKTNWYCPKCMTTNCGLPKAPKYGPLRRVPIGTPKPENVWPTHLEH